MLRLHLVESSDDRRLHLGQALLNMPRVREGHEDGISIELRRDKICLADRRQRRLQPGANQLPDGQ